jgi:hypothetical protein
MVKLSSGGNYIKGADVKHGDTIKFLDEGEWSENTRYKYPDGNNKWDFTCKVEHNGEEKKLRINSTNKKALIAAWGDETKEWIGKTARMSVETALIGGERKKTILLDPEGAKPAIGDIAWDE